MNIPSSLKYQLGRQFCSPLVIKGPMDSKVSIKAIKVTDGMFIPTIVTSYIKEMNNSLIDVDEVIVPLHNCICGPNCTTASRLLTSILTITSNYNCITYKLEGQRVFHGYRGLLMDEDYHPLLILGYKLSTDLLQDIQEVTLYRDATPVCIVSPRVYSNTDKVSKYVRDKVVPYIATNQFIIGSYAYDEKYVNVVISNKIDDLIIKAKAPKSIDYSGDLYGVIENYIKDSNT